MIIQHNMAAANTNRQLGINDVSRAKSMERLNSGYRTNRAADDAAGLSISEKMRGQIRGLKRASLNASDGISLIQTAEGGMHEIHSILQRMEELSVQGANDTNVLADREAIQIEMDYLKEEIDRISSQTEFNTLKLLSGEYAASSAALRHAYKRYLKGIEDGTVSEILVTDEAGRAQFSILYEEGRYDVETTQTASGNPTGSVPAPADDAAFKSALKNEIVPRAVQGIMNAYSSTFGYLSGSSIGIGLELYSDSSNTLASVTQGIRAQGEADTESGGIISPIVDLTYTLSVNLNSLEFDSNGELTADSRNDLEVTIIHEMMHGMMFEALTTGMQGYDSHVLPVEAFPSWFVEGTAQASAGGCYDGNDWVNGSMRITPGSTESQILQTLSQASLASGSSQADYGAGYLAVMYLGYLTNGGGTVSKSGVSGGIDTFLNEIKNGSSMDEVIGKYTEYEDTTAFEQGFLSDANAAAFIHELVTVIGGGTGGLVADFDVPLVQGAHSILPNGSASTGGLFELDVTNDKITNRYPEDYPALSGGGRSEGGKALTTSRGPLILQVGANSDQIIRLYIDNMSSAAIGLTTVSVLSHDDATRTIENVQKAIEKVSLQRVTLGAYQNRLEHSVANADNMSENLQASESKIRDADMADEMVTFSKNEILMQAGQAMLAQTNQITQGVVSLLR